MIAVGSIVALLMVLALALYALRSQGLTFERKALYAAVWVVVFLVLTIVFSRVMA